MTSHEAVQDEHKNALNTCCSLSLPDTSYLQAVLSGKGDVQSDWLRTIHSVYTRIALHYIVSGSIDTWAVLIASR